MGGNGGAGFGAGAGAGFDFWGTACALVAGLRTLSATFTCRAGRLGLGGSRLAITRLADARLTDAPLAGVLTRAGLFGCLLEELTPEFPDPAD